MSSFSNDMDFGSSSLSDTSKGLEGEGVDTELQEFLQVEQYKAEMRSQIQQLADVCWDKCVEKPQAKLDTKTQNCLSNCVARFVDVSQLITNRYVQGQQKALQGGH